MMTTMQLVPGSSLREIQSRMQSHVLTGDAQALADVDEAGGLSAERRLHIYHHAYRARLLETMRDTFGHTWRYLGDDWFDHLALAYIESHPSRHANLRWYGETWPDWLAGTRLADAGAGDHPEVAELASLDWSLRRAFDAADRPVATLADLAAVPPEAWADVTLVAQPSVATLTVRHNSLALWHALDQDEAVPEAQPLPAPVGVLVWRQDERPHFRSVSPQEDVALTAMLLGRSFGDICALLAERFLDDDATLLAAGMLRRWIDEGLLARFSAVAGEASALSGAEHHV